MYILRTPYNLSSGGGRGAGDEIGSRFSSQFTCKVLSYRVLCTEQYISMRTRYVLTYSIHSYNNFRIVLFEVDILRIPVTPFTFSI